MTVYAWPDTRNFQPQGQELRVVDNTQRTMESALSGYVQTTGMPGARWGWSFDMAPQTGAERAALEAYLLRLSGRQHRVQLWDLKNPRPRGNIYTSGITMGATAAQFATSLVLAGCRSKTNVLFGGSFEIDSNTDGLADGWTRYSAGSFGGLTQARSTGIVAHGTYSQALSASSLGSTASDRQGISKSGVVVTTLAGGTATLSCKVLGSLNSSIEMQLVWRDITGTVISSLTTSVALTTGLQTITLSGACPSNAATCLIYIFQHSNTGASPNFYVDAVQLQAGATATAFDGYATLLAGDWLGLAGGQLVRVVADATGNDAGAMTVEVRHMLRASVASASAVTLEKPTALYVRTESGLAMPRQPGNAEPGLSIDLVEVFA
jgi:hypothetical protein